MGGYVAVQVEELAQIGNTPFHEQQKYSLTLIIYTLSAGQSACDQVHVTLRDMTVEILVPDHQQKNWYGNNIACDTNIGKYCTSVKKKIVSKRDGTEMGFPKILSTVHFHKFVVV